MAGSDHLIERAAALLQGSTPRALGSGPPVEGLPGNASVPDLTVPSRPAVPAAPTFAPPSFAASSFTRPPVPAGFTVPPLAEGSQPRPVPVSTRAPPRAEPTPAGDATISLDTLERAGMVVARTARTRISEEYRIVIGRVLRALRTEPEGGGLHNVVLVTSARPGEGKSFSSLNLAGSLAQHGTDKVLLIDLDAKQMPLSAQLGVGDRIGLHDLIVNPALRYEDVILQTAVPNLQFMPVGTRVTEAMDATGVRPMPPTINRIARRFPKHVIILDAPPCLSTSDPHTIAPHVGQVVMVVEAERTQRTEVEAAIDLVRVCPTITILLNKVRLTTSHTFGAYDYYGSYS